MLISDITALLDCVAPPSTAESWDNPGLQIGSLQKEATACLLALDVTVDTVREAVHESLGRLQPVLEALLKEKGLSLDDFVQAPVVPH